MIDNFLSYTINAFFFSNLLHFLPSSLPLVLPEYVPTLPNEAFYFFGHPYRFRGFTFSVLVREACLQSFVELNM